MNKLIEIIKGFIQSDKELVFKGYNFINFIYCAVCVFCDLFRDRLDTATVQKTITVLVLWTCTVSICQSSSVLRKGVYTNLDRLKKIGIGLYFIFYGPIIFLMYGIVKLKSDVNIFLWVMLTLWSIIGNFKVISYLLYKCDNRNRDFIYSCLTLGFLLNVLFLPFNLRFFLLTFSIQICLIIYISLDTTYNKKIYIETFIGIIPKKSNKTSAVYIGFKASLKEKFQRKKSTIIQNLSNIIKNNRQIVYMRRLIDKFKSYIVYIIINIIQMNMFIRAYQMFYKTRLFPDSGHIIIYFEALTIMSFSIFVYSLYMFMICIVNGMNTINKIYSIGMILSLVLQFIIAYKLFIFSLLWLLALLIMCAFINKPTTA